MGRFSFERGKSIGDAVVSRNKEKDQKTTAKDTDDLIDALENLMMEVLDIRGIDVEQYKPEAFKKARDVISKAKGDTK